MDDPTIVELLLRITQALEKSAAQAIKQVEEYEKQNAETLKIMQERDKRDLAQFNRMQERHEWDRELHQKELERQEVWSKKVADFKANQDSNDKPPIIGV